MTSSTLSCKKKTCSRLHPTKSSIKSSPMNIVWGWQRRKSKSPPLLQAKRVSPPSTHVSTNQGDKTHQAQVNKKKRMRKIVMMNQVQVMKNIQGPCYTTTARLPSMYMSSMSLGTKHSLEGVRLGWRRWQRKRASQEIKLYPPSTSPRKVVKAQVKRTTKIPRAPPLIALEGHHHHPCVLWH